MPKRAPPQWTGGDERVQLPIFPAAMQQEAYEFVYGRPKGSNDVAGCRTVREAAAKLKAGYGHSGSYSGDWGYDTMYHHAKGVLITYQNAYAQIITWEEFAAWVLNGRSHSAQLSLFG
jgi:hypothetical protein